MKTPAYHTFINTKVISDSPAELFWAGIGDALSKEYEVLFVTRDKPMYHTPLMGHCISTICTEPLLTYGKQALADRENHLLHWNRLHWILSFQQVLCQILKPMKHSRIRRMIIITTVHLLIVFIMAYLRYRQRRNICTGRSFPLVCCVC